MPEEADLLRGDGGLELGPHRAVAREPQPHVRELSHRLGEVAQPLLLDEAADVEERERLVVLAPNAAVRGRERQRGDRRRDHRPSRIGAEPDEPAERAPARHDPRVAGAHHPPAEGCRGPLQERGIGPARCSRRRTRAASRGAASPRSRRGSRVTSRRLPTRRRRPGRNARPARSDATAGAGRARERSGAGRARRSGGSRARRAAPPAPPSFDGTRTRSRRRPGARSPAVRASASKICVV